MSNKVLITNSQKAVKVPSGLRSMSILKLLQRSA